MNTKGYSLEKVIHWKRDQNGQKPQVVVHDFDFFRPKKSSSLGKKGENPTFFSNTHLRAEK